MKTIGVIGGMGPQATMDFEARIHRISQKLIPQFVNRGYPPMVVYYVREAPMVLNSDGSTPEKLEPAPQLLDAAKKLGAVADFLVIASNTPHFFKKEIEEAAGLRILSIVQVTLEKIKRERYKKVGIIAVGDTLKHRLYQEPLERMGLDGRKGCSKKSFPAGNYEVSFPSGRRGCYTRMHRTADSV